MPEEFAHLFEPLRLRHKTLTSRITFGAHTANMAEGGLPGERHIGYYRERVLGGAGMIVVEPVPVHRTAVLTRGNFRHDDDAIIPAFRRLTDACREANPDIVMIHQLYHIGQHSDADNSFAPNWSPSGLPSYHDADGSHAVSAAEIEELIEGFVAAAGRAQASGFDGIEIFAGYNALVDQFWTPVVEPANRRVGRVVREPDALLVGDPAPDPRALRGRLHHRAGGQRRSGVGGVPVDRRARRDRGVARRAAADGLRHLRDRLVLPFRGDHPDVAVRRAAGRAVRRGAQGGRPDTRWSRPRATSGRPPRPRPSWPPVMPTWSASSAARSPTRTWSPRPAPGERTRSGRASRATSCAGAVGRATTGSRASSTRRRGANGNGAATGSRRASDPRRVLVVGGGPAGLEAARVAAERGHRVTLVERGPVLGGQFRLAGLQPSRGQITDLLAWFGRRLETLGVEVRLDVEATADWVAIESADEVVVATGSRPPRDRVPASAAAGRSTPRRGRGGRVLDPRRARRHGRPGSPRPRPRRRQRLARPRDGHPPRGKRATT